MNLYELYERVWYDVYVARCIKGEDPADAELVADGALDHFKSRRVRIEEQIVAGYGVAA